MISWFRVYISQTRSVAPYVSVCVSVSRWGYVLNDLVSATVWCECIFGVSVCWVCQGSVCVCVCIGWMLMYVSVCMWCVSVCWVCVWEIETKQEHLLCDWVTFWITGELKPTNSNEEFFSLTQERLNSSGRNSPKKIYLWAYLARHQTRDFSPKEFGGKLWASE